MDYEELKKQIITKTLCVQIQTDLYDGLKELAKSHDLSMRKIIEKLVEVELKTIKKKNR